MRRQMVGRIFAGFRLGGARERCVDDDGQYRENLTGSFHNFLFVPLKIVQPVHTPASFTARPPPDKFARRISEYLREKMIPSAPASSAALVAAKVSSGVAFRELLPVGISISIPGRM